MPSVASDNEVGTHIERAIRRVGPPTGNRAIGLDQLDRLRTHAQVERRIALAAVGEEIEEVPLRHECDELAAGRQLREIREGVLVTAEVCAQSSGLLVRELEEVVEQAELAHDVQGRGMNGVAAKVAQEIGVLLKHDDVDSGTRQQEAE